MIIARVDHDQMTVLAEMLSAEALPIGDLEALYSRFYRFDDGNGLVGFGGLEGTGPDRLLRSFIIASPRRGKALGGAMLAALERAAADEGATCLYLLTTTAAPFFRRFGYGPAERADAPAPIADSAEFRSLCPADAAFLSKRIC
ncbi:tyrosine protein phosphatase (plasmid) [Sphingobium sp. SCG-1]|uniref:arsenic resistance N-acetyltransferase ArsN2 n=1 Tax=Sphingobium sp. SCG-1 TaxID=2072936 RepID=UPI000CD6A816|nr:arsenic resistance N-acetyltransferase ArsN2 [Sphingobium sp. SCG-1]AUW60520.1 tyrosine protein phosphatase [Sphingobium sp. SCG-1]